MYLLVYVHVSTNLLESQPMINQPTLEFYFLDKSGFCYGVCCADGALNTCTDRRDVQISDFVFAIHLYCCITELEK